MQEQGEHTDELEVTLLGVELVKVNVVLDDNTGHGVAIVGVVRRHNREPGPRGLPGELRNVV